MWDTIKQLNRTIDPPLIRFGDDSNGEADLPAAESGRLITKIGWSISVRESAISPNLPL